MGRCSWFLVLQLGVALTLAACGESAEEEALADVCEARASIQSHIEDLEGLRITAATDDESAEAADARSILSAINTDVGDITDASDELVEDTRQQVEAATADFRSSLDTALIRGVDEADYGRLTDPLVRSYEETLGSIECE